MNAPNIFARANGDRVAYEEYGAAAGTPVIFCHGWPSSRTMAALAEEAARELNIRLISPDRPGVRDSTFVANRKLLDWPPLLREFADHLGLAQFRMFGISGGAPYAFVSAWAMPERVRAIAVASGAPPISDLENRDGLLPLYRWLLRARAKMPRRLYRMGFRFARPFLSLRPPKRSRPALLKLLQPTDANALLDERAFDACFESQRQAWKVSSDGVLADAEIYAEPWGFSLGEIKVPVRLWHGRKDRSFAEATAREVERRLPNVTAFYVEDAGHYSTPIRNIRDILADLIAT
ncbi:MAG: alpha/beta hydrolase [Verrucomicrobiota bacterium]|nr:alpha/beta hydrolase [Verrucomicrobiota bacterium]